MLRLLLLKLFIKQVEEMTSIIFCSKLFVPYIKLIRIRFFINKLDNSHMLASLHLRCYQLSFNRKYSHSGLKPVHDKDFTILGNPNRSDCVELPGSSATTAHLKLENPIFIKNTQGVVTSVCHKNITVFQFFSLIDGPNKVYG